MYDFNALKDKLEGHYYEIEASIDGWISEQNCSSQEEWQSLMSQAENIDWPPISSFLPEREITVNRIQVKWDDWADENK